MKKRSSQITFSEAAAQLNYIKIVWNGETIFDEHLDMAFDSHEKMYAWYGENYVDTHWGLKGLKYVQSKYNDKHIYSMFVRIVEFHHCEIYIEGEK